MRLGLGRKADSFLKRHFEKKSHIFDDCLWLMRYRLYSINRGKYPNTEHLRKNDIFSKTTKQNFSFQLYSDEISVPQYSYHVWLENIKRRRYYVSLKKSEKCSELRHLPPNSEQRGSNSKQYKPLSFGLTKIAEIISLAFCYSCTLWNTTKEDLFF